MSAFSAPSPERSPAGRRTIRATFITMVLVPVISMLVVWGLLLAGVFGGALADPDAPGRDHQDVADIFLVVGAALVIILISVALMGLFARRIAHDIGGLEVTVQHLADEEMPQLVEKLRRGEQVTGSEARPPSQAVTAEVAHAEAAIASLQSTAAAAAAGEASLRNGIGQVFVSLARRNQSLLQRQLRLIDALEQKASDPATLADLFPLDHLTTRMRRHAEGLIILSGAAPGRSWSEPVPVIDVIRGAVAEVEDYKRVTVLTRAEDAVAGQAVADMIHLLAELIENATLSSPSGTRVEVRAERVANGFAIEVDDRGLGIEAGQLAAINTQLAHPPDFDLANADQLGLFVVGKLAARHGVRVALRPSPYGGTTAVVLMPNSIVVPLNVTDAATQPDLRALGRGADLDLPTADALALPGRRPVPPLPAGSSSQRGIGASPADLAPATAGFTPSAPEFAPSPDFTPGADLTQGPADLTASPADLAGGAAAAGPGSGTDPFGATGFSLGPPGPSAGSPGIGSLSSRSAGTGPPATDSSVFAPDSFRPAPRPAGTGGGPAAPGGADDGAAPGAPGSLVPEPRPAAGTYRGLPRRVRQASLNPHLRDTSTAAARAAQDDGAAPADDRSPEAARDLVASLQSGWQRGRETDPAAAQTTDGADTAAAEERDGRHGGEAPQNGEG
ncbi:MAG TPA: ATP-binding protein [Streptosporangiaceae bacterium]